MRYEVKTARSDWRDNNSSLGYYVEDNRTLFATAGYDHEFATAQLTKAEANIIAFALNAIAEGRQLEAWDHANHNSRDYDGPTEGVAP